MCQGFRIIVLGTLCTSVFITVGKLSIDSTAGNRLFRPFIFPTTIPLRGWQLARSQSLNEHSTNRTNQTLAGYQYHYRQTGKSLEVKVRYVVNTDGDVEKLLREKREVLPDAILEQVNSPFGQSFRFLNQKNQIHWTTCLNPQGNSTVTRQQFQQHRYRLAGSPSYFYQWILGQKPLIDSRCLWIYSTIVVDPKSTDNVRAIAAETELQIVHGWQTQFPKP